MHYISGYASSHRNSKHIDYRHHFVRVAVQREDFAMQYAATADQIADIFNKALDPVPFIKFRNCLMRSRATLNIVEKIEKQKGTTEQNRRKRKRGASIKEKKSLIQKRI